MAKLVLEVIRNYLLPIALGGVIGGLIAGAFFIWPTVYGAQWWEVFTAVGTIGATISAVWIAINNRRLFEKEEQRKLLVDIRAVIKPGLTRLEWKLQDATSHTYEYNLKKKAEIDEELIWLESMNTYSLIRHYESLCSDLLELKALLIQLSRAYQNSNSHYAMHLIVGLREDLIILRHRIEEVYIPKGL